MTTTGRVAEDDPDEQTQRGISLYEAKFFGESGSDDCVNKSDIDCICEDKAAIMLFSNQDDNLKPLMPTSIDDVPLYRTAGYGTWNGFI